MSIKQAIEALEVAQCMVDWCRNLHPQQLGQADHEADAQIAAALAALRSMPAEPVKWAMCTETETPCSACPTAGIPCQANTERPRDFGDLIFALDQWKAAPHGDQSTIALNRLEAVIADLATKHTEAVRMSEAPAFDHAALYRAMELASLLAGSVGMSDVSKSNGYSNDLRAHLSRFLTPSQPSARLADAHYEAHLVIREILAESSRPLIKNRPLMDRAYQAAQALARTARD